MNDDLISRSEAKKLGATCLARRNENGQLEAIISLDDAPPVTPSLILDNITEEDVEKFKMIWQRATGKGLCVIHEERQPEIQMGGWIPVSERLPHCNGVYSVTRKLKEGETIYFISDASYFDGQNTWHRDVCVNHGRPYLTDVIAWQPRPEPYMEEDAKEEAKHEGV